jgi:hypothetical protein
MRLSTIRSRSPAARTCLLGGLAALQLLATDVLAQSSDRGAHLMPYTRYEADVASLTNAQVLQTTNFDISTTASEASQQKFVNLPNAGSAVEFTVTTAGNGVTMRYTMPDSADGKGLNGEVDVYINGQLDKTVAVTSRWAWQYFLNKEPENTPTPFAGTDYIAMRFDETHFMLSRTVNPGDKIRIQKKTNDNNAYGIDFIELEPVPAALPKPAGYVSIADFGGVPNDGNSDLAAFNSAVTAAGNAGTGVYLPPGKWDFNNKVVLNTSNIGIKGAGMWYTNINYSNPAQFSGGILARVNGVEVSDIYFSTVNTQRMCRDMACPIGGPYMIYKAFMGTWGKNSKFTRVWAEHFEVGAWLGGYDAPYPVDYTDGLVISQARFRNNYADGINFSQGTMNSVVEHTNIRNSGDDGLAMWPSNSPAVPEEVNNIFRYNTVEHVFRAGGVAIFGGKNHQVHNMLIRDCFGGAAIRFTTDFPGYTFSNEGKYLIHDIDIYNCGTSYDLWHQKRGAIEFNTPSGVRNMQFDNIYIKNSQRHAIQMVGNSFTNIVFNNTTIDGSGLDATVRNVPQNVYGGVGLYGEANGAVTFNNVYIGNMEDANMVNQNAGFNLVANFLPLPNGSSSSSVATSTSSATSISATSSSRTSSSTSSATSSATTTSSSGPSSSSSSVAAGAFTIMNRWKNTYLCDGGDSVNYSATASGPACQWVTENVGSGFVEIRNQATGDYMHIENQTGRVQATARAAGWDSSKWQLENVDGTFSRIKNRWQPAQYVHVENQNGFAQHGTIDQSWWSAQWKFTGVDVPVSSSSSSAATTSSSSSVVSGYDIVNRWSKTYINDAGTNANYVAQSGPNSHWVLEPVGNGVFEIRNTATGEYLNIESNNGTLQSTPRQPTWDSSKWTLEDTGDGYVRIRSRWLTWQFLHVENQTGNVQVGSIYDVWQSAQWQLVTWGGGNSSTSSSKTSSSSSSSVATSSATSTSRSSSSVTSTSSATSSSAVTSSSVATSSSVTTSSAGSSRGYAAPWTEYQLEAGRLGGNAKVLAPNRTKWDKNIIQAEAIGRSAVQLNSTGDSVAITNTKPANSVVLRYSIPDSASGGGIDATLGLYINGVRVKSLALTSKYAWSYKGGLIGDPIVDIPAEQPHTFFDEVAVLTDPIPVGAEVKIQRDAQDTAAFYVVDLIDLEQVAPPLTMPAGFTDVTTLGIIPNSGIDYADKISSIMNSGAKLWFPPGEYLALKLTSGNAGMDNKGAEVRGAGMWYTTIKGPKSIFFCIGPVKCVFGDFSIRGESKARAEESQGVQKAFAGPMGVGSIIENMWIEHVVGAIWVGNDPPYQTQPTDNLTIRHVRIRNTYADGVNLDNGTSNSLVENSHFRNTGDDAAVVWSIRWTHWVRDKTVNAGPNFIKPEARNAPDQGIGHGNTFRNLTVQMPWRANCYAAYGGYDNLFENLKCEDVLTYPGILIDNEFSSYPFGPGLTTFRNIDVIRAGGPMFFENGNVWKHGALKFYMREGDVNDILVENVNIVAPTYSGIEFRGFGTAYVPVGEKFSSEILAAADAAVLRNVTLRNITITNAGTYGIEVLDGGGDGQVTFEGVKVSGSAIGPLDAGGAPNSFFNKTTGNTGW